jgi:hypothetical protein
MKKPDTKIFNEETWLYKVAFRDTAESESGYLPV